MSRVIGVLSSKGGVGKTTIVANVGAVLTNFFNKNVLIFDSNIHSSHLGLHLGMYEEPRITLREVLSGRASIIHAIHIHSDTGIRIVPAPLNGKGADLIGNKSYRLLIDQIKDSYDIVVLDCAPGLGRDVLTAIDAIDEALVVTLPDLPALTDALRTIRLLEKLNKKILGIIINRYRKKNYEFTKDEVESASSCNVIGIVPEDEKVPESICDGIPVVLSHPYSNASIAFKRLAANLIGVDHVDTGFLGRIKEFFNLGKLLKFFS